MTTARTPAQNGAAARSRIDAAARRSAVARNAATAEDNAEAAGPSALILITAVSMTAFLAIQLVAAVILSIGGSLAPIDLGGGATLPWLAPTAMALTAAIMLPLRFGAAGLTRAAAIGALTGAALLWASAALLSGSVYDWSWDGQHYHQELVIQLAQGWNPVWRPFEGQGLAWPDSELPLWLDHYPRAGGVAGVAIYQLTGALETAKYLNPLLMALTGLYAAGLLRSLAGLSWRWSTLLALALASNAIAASQLLSFYNDGALFAGVALIAMGGAHLLARPGPAPALILLGAVMLTVNLKFTGLALAVATLGSVGVAALTLAGGRVRAVVPLGLFFAAALILAVAAVGPSSYLQNIAVAGHPFHPVMGADSFDIMTRSTPQAFREISSLDALFASLLGAPEVGIARYETRPPFSLVPVEALRLYAFVDPRVGGWGPLFAEQLLVALAGAALLLAVARPKRWPLIGAFALGMTLLVAVLHPEAWWARYSSFLLLGPWAVFAAAAAHAAAVERSGAAGVAVVGPRLLAALGVALMLANNAPVLWVATAKAHEMTAKIEASVAKAQAAGGPITLSTGLFHSNRVKLQEAGVAFQLAPTSAELPCPEPEVFYNGHWISRICL